MARTSTHVIETKSRDYIRNVIDNYYANGDALFREISERDYGIDALIELFDEGIPTGRLCLVQLKGTEKSIVPLQDGQNISCKISTSNAQYARQRIIPVVLFYVSIKEPGCFYFTSLNEAVETVNAEVITQQASITVHIPVSNNGDHLELLFRFIADFYDREVYA